MATDWITQAHTHTLLTCGHARIHSPIHPNHTILTLCWATATNAGLRGFSSLTGLPRPVPLANPSPPLASCLLAHPGNAKSGTSFSETLAAALVGGPLLGLLAFCFAGVLGVLLLALFAVLVLL